MSPKRAGEWAVGGLQLGKRRSLARLRLKSQRAMHAAQGKLDLERARYAILRRVRLEATDAALAADGDSDAQPQEQQPPQLTGEKPGSNARQNAAGGGGEKAEAEAQDGVVGTRKQTLMEGFLTMQTRGAQQAGGSPRHGWRRRWFELRPAAGRTAAPTLAWKRDRSDAADEQVSVLRPGHTSVSDEGAHHAQKHCFVVKCMDQVVVLVSAETFAAKAAWIAALGPVVLAEEIPLPPPPPPQRVPPATAVLDSQESSKAETAAGVGLGRTRDVGAQTTNPPSMGGTANAVGAQDAKLAAALLAETEAEAEVREAQERHREVFEEAQEQHREEFAAAHAEHEAALQQREAR